MNKLLTLKILVAAIMFISLVGSNVSAQEQVVTPAPASQTAGAYQPVSVDVIYSTADPVDESLMGLGLRMHYDSSKLSFSDLINAIGAPLQNIGSPQPDAGNEDGDDNTDTIVIVSWADMDQQWPGEGTTPALLYTANFTTDVDFSGSTHINFSAISTAIGRTLDPTSATITKTSN